MKLVRFAVPREQSYGVMDKDRVICLPALAKALCQPFPSTIEAAVSAGIREVHIEKLLQKATKAVFEEAVWPLQKVQLLAPIAKPPKIVCLGLNYRDHAAEQGKLPAEEPIIFLKPSTAIIGPNEDVIKPCFVEQLDYEAELAVIIGKRSKNISVEDAEMCIFGYTIFNDVSARDIQFRDTQWTRGKCFDTFAPTGPCITLADQIADPANLQVRTWINRELRQNSNTNNMVFNVYQIVHNISWGMTLEPCDIIATGTPAGVGFAMKPEPKFLKNGDLMEIEIESIGTLGNRVAEQCRVHC